MEEIIPAAQKSKLGMKLSERNHPCEEKSKLGMKTGGSNAWNTRGCEQEELTSVNGECPSEKAAKAVSPKRQQNPQVFCCEHSKLTSVSFECSGPLRPSG